MLSATCFLVVAFLLTDAILRRTDFFSPFRIYLFSHALTLGIASLGFHHAMTPFTFKTNAVYFGSGIGFLSGYLMSLFIGRLGSTHIRIIPLKSENYNWSLHFWFSLLVFTFFLMGMALAYKGVGEFPLLAEDNQKVLKKFMSYHWTSNVPISFGAFSMILFFMSTVVKKPRVLGTNLSLWLLILNVIVFCLALSRSGLIFFAFFALVFYHYAIKRLSILKLSFIFILLLSGFLITAYLKLSSMEKSNQYSNVQTGKAMGLLLQIPYIYVANNFWNLDYALNPENHEVRHKPTYGFTSFSGIFDMIYTGSHWGPDLRESLNHEDIYHKKIQKVTGLNTVGYQWGLYKDFGLMGTILIPFGFGFLIQILYSKVRYSPSILNISIYAFVAYLIGFSWFLAFWESQIYVYGFLYLLLCTILCQFSSSSMNRSGFNRAAF